MFQEISEIMNPGSLLFFLDRPNSDMVKSCGGISGDIQNFELVYEEIYDFFNLHPAAIEKNYYLYEKHFGANVCNTCFKVFCRSWIRSECERNLVESPVCLITDSSEFPTDCSDSIATSPAGLRSSLVPQKMRAESLEESLLPFWLRTECGKCLGDQIITLESSGGLAPPLMKSEAGNNFECPSHMFECGESLATSSTEYVNTLESVPVSLRSQSSNSLIISPRNRFRNKREKFDLLEFFRLRPYETCHHLFCLRMEGVGWNERGIQVYSQSYQEMWNDLHVTLLEKIKLVEDVQEELIVYAQRHSGDVCFPIWKKFMIYKRELAFVKRQIYSEIVITLRGHLKSVFPITKAEQNM